MPILAAFLFLGLIVFTPPQVRAESTSGTLPHMTDFLTFPACGECGTTWYPRAVAGDRSILRQSINSRGYKHWYLSVTSASHNYYGNSAGFNVFLQELNNSSIKPVVWLTSDSGNWRNQSVDIIKSDLSTFIPQIDSLVNSYVLGLEIDEYWTLDKANQIGAHLDSLTAKPLAAHQLPGNWNYCSTWCDYLIFQYGFGRSLDEIQTMTANAINSLGKPVVAGEYNTTVGTENLSIVMGDTAVAAGASGFGNGGTPFSTGPTSTPTRTPTPGVNNAPVAQNSTTSTPQNTQVYIQLSFTDPDGPGPYTYTITTQPTHGSLSGTDNDRYYLPAAGYTGVDSFRWKVNDSLVDSNIAIATVNITSSPTSTPVPGSLISNLTVYDTANAFAWSIQSNLQSGNTQYNDRTYTWNTVPSLVAGSQWIRTANLSRSYTGSPVATFSLTAPATVYIAFDDRYTEPSWMSGYTDTGQDMVNSEPNPYSLYSASYSSPQTISLGPVGSGSYGMYSVIVKASSVPGDGNGDGHVNGVDYMIWYNHYKQSVSGPANGDYNSSGYVDGVDYMIWLTNYGR